MPQKHFELPADLSERLRATAEAVDQAGNWPQAELDALAAAGAMKWAVPREFGGEDCSALELYLRYEAIAGDTLTLALILSQRDSAVAMIDSADQWVVRGGMLKRLANNELFITVGIAQLTTSRQGGPPVLRAAHAGGGYRIDGYIPWATGAAQAEIIITGAVLDDGGQILFALPTGSEGVTVDPPMPLVSLRASWTTRIACDGVTISGSQLLRSPVPSALAGRKKSIALGQAFLGTGLCRGALDLIEAHNSAAARQASERFGEQLQKLRQRVLELSAEGREEGAAAAAGEIRAACNDLALRITHAAVTLYKGTALLTTHPAQRLAREALFLLVWSCPNPVIDCTVELLSSG